MNSKLLLDFYFSKLFFQFIAGIGIALGGGCFYFAEDLLKIGKYSPNSLVMDEKLNFGIFKI